MQKIQASEEKANLAKEKYTRARMIADALEVELRQQDEKNSTRVQEYNEKLKAAQFREEETAREYYKILDSLDKGDAETKELDNKLSDEQRKQVLEETRNELQTIKKLWTHDYGWNKRFEVENEIISEGNSPFIRNISFIGFEGFIKKLAVQKLKYSPYTIKAHEGPTVSTLIDELAAASIISEKNKNFYHEVRIARNNWLHEGKPPSALLLKRLVDNLEKANPATRPIL